jgi:DNA-directed RNA polymerase beta' subunit
MGVWGARERMAERIEGVRERMRNGKNPCWERMERQKRILRIPSLHREKLAEGVSQVFFLYG